MPVSEELRWVEDLVIVELRRHYPDEVMGANLQGLGVPVEAMRSVLSELEADGVVIAGDGGWSWVDPSDGSPVPVPREARVPSEAASDDDDLPLGPVPVPTLEAADEFDDVIDDVAHYRAAFTVVVSFDSASDSGALALSRAVPHTIMEALAEMQVVGDVTLDEVQAYDHPRRIA
jgi:hypothetical protein